MFSKIRNDSVLYQEVTFIKTITLWNKKMAPELSDAILNIKTTYLIRNEDDFLQH